MKTIINGVKYRSIMFHQLEVQATLENLATQTRKIVRAKLGSDCPKYMWPHAINDVIEWREQNDRWFGCMGYRTLAYADCPYGKVGDRLWVSEYWRISPFGSGWSMDDSEPCRGLIDYKHAESIEVTAPNFDAVEKVLTSDWDWDFPSHIYRSPRKMPYWASRILLEITGIRIERLNNINESDCIKSGMGSAILRDCKKPKFIQFWESIYGARSWNQSPWVWVIDYKVVEVKA